MPSGITSNLILQLMYIPSEPVYVQRSCWRGILEINERANHTKARCKATAIFLDLNLS